MAENEKLSALIGPIRPMRPTLHSKAAGVTIVGHYILPYSMVREAWNRVVTCLETTELPEARVTARQFTRMSNPHLPEVESLLDSVKTRSLTFGAHDKLLQSVAWAPWNVVDGPANRSDDPEKRAFKLDRFVVGVTAAELARMSVIERLYHAVERFNNSRVPSAALKDLSGEIVIARATLGSVEKPIEFRPRMWEREESGKWRKRRSNQPPDDAAGK